MLWRRLWTCACLRTPLCWSARRKARCSVLWWMGPAFTQALEGLVGQGHQSLLVALAAHPQEHAGGVQVGDLQAAPFIQAQGAGINGRQANSINERAHGTENFLNFLP